MSEEKANLGLATTRELLEEIAARIMIDYYSGGGGLDYSTVHGRPEGDQQSGTQLLAEYESQPATAVPLSHR